MVTTDAGNPHLRANCDPQGNCRRPQAALATHIYAQIATIFAKKVGNWVTLATHIYAQIATAKLNK